MKPFRFAMLLVALVCFALAGFGVSHPKINLIGIGLAIVTLAYTVA